MIRLTSAAQAYTLRGAVPDISILRMVQFEGEDGLYDPLTHGSIIVLQKGDTLTDVPELAGMTLHQVFDEDWPVYDTLDTFEESGHLVFEIVIQIDNEKTLSIIVPDLPYLDSDLLSYLHREACRRPSPDISVSEKIQRNPST